MIEALCSDRYVAGRRPRAGRRGERRASRVDAGAVDVSSARWTDDGIFAMGLESMDAVALEVDHARGDVREVWRTAEGVGDYQPVGAPLPGGGFVIGTSSARRPPAIVAVREGAEGTIAATAATPAARRPCGTSAGPSA